MQRGTVLYHSKFLFKDGKTGEKRLVVLNSSNSGEPVLLIKTTSKKDKFQNRTRRQLNSGCNTRDSIFLIESTVIPTLFKKDTLLQLDDIYEMTTSGIIQAGFDGDCKIIGSLPENLLGNILSCLTQLKDDIDKKHFELIFKRR